MLTVDEATREVLDRVGPLPPTRIALADALGCLLAEVARADRDSPPFDKALLDGYAVRVEDVAAEGVELEVIEEVTAGRVPVRRLERGQATAIMTGAPMPTGASAVVMVEDGRREGDRVWLFPHQPVVAGYGVMARGREMRAGEELLSVGDELTPARLGLLATVGVARPLVVPSPLVAIAATGDEIVEAEVAPGPGQIRNSNTPVLDALARRAGARTRLSPIAPDRAEALGEILASGLTADILLITGGVSAGKLDLVPGCLEGLGVRTIFHKVRLKPGKPILFGVGPEREGGRPGTLVFGLPGNPVSGVVGFLLFARPAIEALSGRRAEPARRRAAILDRALRHRGDRPTFHPARLLEGMDLGGMARVAPLPWGGSPDLRSLSTADGFVCFPPGDAEYAQESLVEFLSLEADRVSRM